MRDEKKKKKKEKKRKEKEMPTKQSDRINKQEQIMKIEGILTKCECPRECSLSDKYPWGKV